MADIIRQNALDHKEIVIYLAWTLPSIMPAQSYTRCISSIVAVLACRKVVVVPIAS
eukprot:SAG31_NODE_36302_length_314_cov_1.204651_1_plen_55_part_10